METITFRIEVMTPFPKKNDHMPQISRRAKTAGESPIRSLVPFARAAKANGVHIHHLNIGQPDILTPTNALLALKQFDAPIVSYGPSEGKLSLRKTVAQYYEKFNVQLEAEDIYVTTGASEAILFALFSCFDNNDEVIIPEPFYANYLGFGHMANVNIKPITTHLENKFQLPEIESFEAIITKQTKAIFLCNPGNPTGQLYTKSALLKLKEIVIKHDLYLIVDEVYREFCYDDEFFSVLCMPELEKHVVVLDSISKVFSSCGARVGYLVSKNQDLLKVVIKFAQMRLCPPMLGQVLAEACYEDRDNYIEKARIEYQSRRKKLFNRLSTMKEVRCYEPNAAFYNMAELPVDDIGKFCKWLLTDFEYNKQTVMLAPGTGFYANKELGMKQARIAFVLDEEKLDSAMDCLESALDVYSRTMM